MIAYGSISLTTAVVLSSSGGKDSQAMLDLVVELARKAKVMDRVVVIHADLGRADWPGVNALVAEHASHYSLPVYEARRHQNDLLEHIEQRGKFPDAARRYCTSAHKRAPLETVLTALVEKINPRLKKNRPHPDHKPLTRPVRILSCQGLRAQESAHRRKENPFEPPTADATSTVGCLCTPGPRRRSGSAYDGPEPAYTKRTRSLPAYPADSAFGSQTWCVLDVYPKEGA